MSQADLVGRNLGQYELRERLGKGGMATVYRAWQPSLQVERAVKVIFDDLARDPNYLARFNREARTAASLDHPHIISVFDYGVESDISYVVMRLLTGGTVTDRLQQRLLDRGELPALVEVARLLRDIAGALDYAHSKGVVHRDIKGANIMFDEIGNAYVMDFGIAKLMDSTAGITHTHTGMTAGTPHYMAPEQWKGVDISGLSDQYSAAVVVYQLITGKMPFEAETPWQLMSKHISEEPTPVMRHRTDLQPSIGRVLMRALSKDPQDRYPNMMAFSRAFDMAIANEDTDTTGFFTFKVQSRKPNSSITFSVGTTSLEITPSHPSPVPSIMEDAPTMTPFATPPSTSNTGVVNSASPSTASLPALPPPRTLPWRAIAGALIVVIIILVAGLLLNERDGEGGVIALDATRTSTAVSSSTPMLTATSSTSSTPTNRASTQIASADVGVTLAAQISGIVAQNTSLTAMPEATLMPSDLPTVTLRPTATPSPSLRPTTTATRRITPTTYVTQISSATATPLPLGVIRTIGGGNMLVRSGSGTGFRVVARVPSNTTVEIVVIADTIGWANIRLADGTTGWVLLDVLDQLLNATVCKTAIVRAGAGAQFEEIYTALPNDRIEIAGSQRVAGQQWHNLFAQGGWILGANIAIDPAQCS